MATIPQSADRPSKAYPIKRIEGYPPLTWQFELVSVLLSVWFLGGLFVDGWAHNNQPNLESFFTPWHFILYSGFGILALWFAGNHTLNVRKGYRWTHALPQGYGIALVGIGIFALSGLGDMLWHIVFGIEQNLEALFSPTHLGLATGMTLIFAAPLWGTWLKPNGRGWRDLFPAVISLALLYSLWTFFAQYASVYESPTLYSKLALRGVPSDTKELYNIIAYAWIFIPSAILSGLLLFGMRRWQLPFGTVTIMVTANVLAMQLMNANLTEFPPSVVAAVGSGLLADVLIWRLKPSVTRVWQVRLVSWAIPFVYWLAFLASVGLTASGLWWKIPTWSGVPFEAGLFGLLLSFLIFHPSVPHETVA